MPDLFSPNNLVMLAIAVLLCVGIPYVAIFGEKERPYTATARPSPSPPPSYDTSRVSEPQPTYQPPSSDHQAAFSYESAKPVSAETVEIRSEEEEKSAIMEKAGGYSYRGEMPKRKRIDLRQTLGSERAVAG